jgi:hypothetical protein
MASLSLTTAMFSGVCTVFTQLPFFFSVDLGGRRIIKKKMMAWADGTARLR